MGSPILSLPLPVQLHRKVGPRRVRAADDGDQSRRGELTQRVPRGASGSDADGVMDSARAHRRRIRRRQRVED
jgi:hypothetical protein